MVLQALGALASIAGPLLGGGGKKKKKGGGAGGSLLGAAGQIGAASIDRTKHRDAKMAVHTRALMSERAGAPNTASAAGISSGQTSQGGGGGAPQIGGAKKKKKSLYSAAHGGSRAAAGATRMG